ncbi:MAG: hypothetical protein NVS3B20_04930 [Polyangiales bacterium]
MRPVHFASVLSSIVAISCSSGSPSMLSVEATAADSAGINRDFDAHPAIVQVDTADDIYAVSDIHGGFDSIVPLLAVNHLINAANPARVQWTAGRAVLVIAGDMIDKGEKSMEVIDLVRTLQTSASQAGGQVIALMGNHEAEFLADPKNDKATSHGTDAVGIDVELSRMSIDPKDLANAKGAQSDRGKWLQNLPLGARVTKWFFAHGGNTDGNSIKDLEKLFKEAINGPKGFNDKAITGGDSILEKEEWYDNHHPDDTGAKYADKLMSGSGVKHIVFGHNPDAFNTREEIKATDKVTLIKIDCAMGLTAQHGGGKSPGYVLHIRTVGHDTAETLDIHGAKKTIL